MSTVMLLDSGNVIFFNKRGDNISKTEVEEAFTSAGFTTAIVNSDEDVVVVVDRVIYE